MRALDDDARLDLAILLALRGERARSEEVLQSLKPDEVPLGAIERLTRKIFSSNNPDYS
jgi:hypothetical protein